MSFHPCYVYGDSVLHGHWEKEFSWGKIHVLGFHKPGILAHAHIGDISTTWYPCASFFRHFQCSHCLQGKHEVTLGKLVVHHGEPTLVCAFSPYLQPSSFPYVVCDDVKIRRKHFRVYKEYRFRCEPVKWTGKSSHRHYGRKSVFGSYRKAMATREIEEETLWTFPNTRQEKSYRDCGMIAWDENRSRRPRRSWKENKRARKHWMKHV